MRAEEIIQKLKDSRPPYDEPENWSDLEDLGLSVGDKKVLGDIRVVFNTNTNDWDDEFTVVWYFKDHDVYIQGKLSGGSYGVGYRLDTWELKEVFPKIIQVTIYE